MWKPALSLALVAWASVASAGEVRFPLTIDYELLRLAIRKHLREDASGQLQLRSPDGCRTLTVRELTVQPAFGRLRFLARGTAHAGFYLLGWCWAQVSWDGSLDVIARPEIDRGWQLRLQDLDTQLYDQKHQQSGVASRVWELARGWAETELATFTLDLGPPVDEIKALIRGFASPTRSNPPLAAALDTARPVGVTADADAVRVVVAIDVPNAPLASKTPEPALSPAELKRWQAALDGWDGFVAFAVKDLTGTNQDPVLQNELLDILLDARESLVSVLGRGPDGGADPVRPLFLQVWERLRTIVRRVATQGGVESRALRYLTFLAAGDALAAIDTAAPTLGLEISADGLRRLARALDPGYRGDPVDYSEGVDPTLRQRFRFRDPDGPPRRGRRSRPSGRQWLSPRSAYADTASEEWALLTMRLDRWVPTAQELAAYRVTVERLLTVAADRSLDPDLLDERFDDLFYVVVKTVAWQESCWQQYVRRERQIAPLVSRTNDVGMMQINRRVWRGFFDIEKLTWNAAYNAGAGTEILLQLLARYGAREATERLENAARATYSAYNGGPRSYRRYRASDVPPAYQAVDRAFWEKYQAMAGGRAGDRVLCIPSRTS